MLADILALDIFKFFLVFTRLGAILMLLPGFAGNILPTRVRLAFALALSLLVLPVVGPLLPDLPEQPAELFVLIFIEAAKGVFLGVLVQMLMVALAAGGTFIGYQVGLTNAFVFDPVVVQQSSLLTGFLSNTAIVLIFALDLHHLMLRAAVNSFLLFPPGDAPALGEMAETLSRTLTRSFMVGLQLAAPLIVFGLVFQSGLALMAKLMPQMQVFFVSLPLQVLMGLSVLMAGLPAILAFFLGFFEDGLMPFAGG